MAGNGDGMANGNPSALKQLGQGCYVFTSDDGYNSGVVIGANAVLIVDAQPSKEACDALKASIKSISDKPIRYVALTHYHSCQSVQSDAFGKAVVLTTDLTRRLLATSGKSELAASLKRYGDLFGVDAEELTPVEPAMSFASSLTVNLGECEVKILHLGRGHTIGDAIVWVGDAKVMFAGDMVANGSTVYCGEGHLGDWPNALRRMAAFRPNVLVPARGDVAQGLKNVGTLLKSCAEYIAILMDVAVESAGRGNSVKRTFEMVNEVLEPRFGNLASYATYLPFNVGRAYDEAHGLEMPQVWTEERVKDLFEALNAKTHLSDPAEADGPEEGAQADTLADDLAAELEAYGEPAEANEADVSEAETEAEADAESGAEADAEAADEPAEADESEAAEKERELADATS